MKSLKWDGKIVQLLEIIIDLAIMGGSYVAALLLMSAYSFSELLDGDIITRDFLLTLFFISVIVIILFRIYKVSVVKLSYINILFRLGISLIIVLIVLTFLSVVHMDYALLRRSFVLMLVPQFLIISVYKGLVYKFIRKVNVKNSLILGPEEEVNTLAQKFIFDDDSNTYLKYLVYENFDNEELNTVFGYINNVDQVYITENLSTKRKNIVISYCYKNNISCYLVPKLYELSINNAPVDQIEDTLVYKINGLGLTLEQRFIKRTFDLFVSVIGLIITTPIMLVLAMIIKLYDRGPVLFKQERITKDNKKFMLTKFRTMIPNAEEKTGPVFATDDDDRITKIGKFLRITRLDELPQFFNIIKGDMSIVGPRPERPVFIEQFMEENKDYQYRLKVKAGVTGLAQAFGGYSSSFNEKLRFDIYYITN